MPPKNCFATIIATASPIITIQIGIVDGKLKAKRIPVTTALKSPMVLSLFITLRAMYSNKTHERTLTAVTSSERNPNSTTDIISAGIRAIITSSIMLLVVSTERL